MRPLFALSVLLSLATPAVAGELHLVLNGKAIHLDEGDYNEKNWGLGFEYDFNPEDRWITFVNGSAFKDSNDQWSKYVGPGIKRRVELGTAANSEWHLDVGIIGFLMTRKDFNDNDPFLGALPFVSLGTRAVAVNATYIPSVTPKHKKLLYFQLQFRLAEF